MLTSNGVPPASEGTEVVVGLDSDYDLRVATKADIQLILPLVQKFHVASPYHSLGFDPVSAIQIIHSCLDNGVIILAGDKGFIGGTIIQVPCTVAKCATEMGWHVDAGVGERTVIVLLRRLQEAFEYWARNVAQVDFVLAGSFHPSSFFTKRGYVPCEQVYLGALT